MKSSYQEKLYINGDAATSAAPSGDFCLRDVKKTKKSTVASRSPNRTTDGLPKKMTTDQLTCPESLQALFEQYTGPLIEYDFFALAVRAVRKGTNPPALFRRLLEDGATFQITVEEEHRARAMLRRLREKEPRCRFWSEIVQRFVHEHTIKSPTKKDQERRAQMIRRQIEELMEAENRERDNKAQRRRY